MKNNVVAKEYESAMKLASEIQMKLNNANLSENQKTYFQNMCKALLVKQEALMGSSN